MYTFLLNMNKAKFYYQQMVFKNYIPTTRETFRAKHLWEKSHYSRRLRCFKYFNILVCFLQLVPQNLVSPVYRSPHCKYIVFHAASFSPRRYSGEKCKVDNRKTIALCRISTFYVFRWPICRNTEKSIEKRK